MSQATTLQVCKILLVTAPADYHDRMLWFIDPQAAVIFFSPETSFKYFETS